MVFLELYLLIGLSWGISKLITIFYLLFSNSQSKRAIEAKEGFQSLIDEFTDLMDVSEAAVGAFILTLLAIFAVIFPPIVWPYLVFKMIKKSLNKKASEVTK